MNEIYDGDHIEADLNLLRQVPATAVQADMLEVLLDEIASSDATVRVLTDWPGHNSNPYFNTKGIDFLQRQGFNCYRLRPMHRRLRDYRILYAFDVVRNDFYLLAIVKKKPHDLLPEDHTEDYYDYEPHHPITKRICAEYEAMGLQKTC